MVWKWRMKGFIVKVCFPVINNYLYCKHKYLYLYTNTPITLLYRPWGPERFLMHVTLRASICPPQFGWISTPHRSHIAPTSGLSYGRVQVRPQNYWYRHIVYEKKVNLPFTLNISWITHPHNIGPLKSHFRPRRGLHESSTPAAAFLEIRVTRI